LFEEFFLFEGFNCLRRLIACGVQLPAAFNCRWRSIACGVQCSKVQLPSLFNVQLPAAFKCSKVQSSIACGIQVF
jgi:hypothetical protein